MRITCHTLGELLENLKAVAPTSVFQRTVYTSTSRRPLDNENKYKAVKFAIVFQVSAVIGTEEGGEYILESAEECGFDYTDASNEAAGTMKADALRNTLVEHCDDAGLKVRPGIVEN